MKTIVLALVLMLAADSAAFVHSRKPTYTFNGSVNNGYFHENGQWHAVIDGDDRGVVTLEDDVIYLYPTPIDEGHALFLDNPPAELEGDVIYLPSVPRTTDD